MIKAIKKEIILLKNLKYNLYWMFSGLNCGVVNVVML